jgi:DNA (cytosine-5)-methyltransferase 1
MMASGHPFGERLFKPTPFEYVTAEEATADLPDLGDARTFQCTYHPDHRMARGIARLLKAQIEIIPIYPRGMNFAKTLKYGQMTPAERNLFPTLTKQGRPCQSTLPTSHAWERIHPQKLFPTIATSASPGCARTGRALHWDQQRIITVLEARRAQGFPDDEVLTGLQAKQWRIIGNSVARTVSVALGLSVWEAWGKNALGEVPDAAGLAAKENVADDIASTMYAFKSAQEDSGALSLDSVTHSERSYRRSLATSRLKSSTSADDTSSSGSTNSSDHVTTKVVQKRRHNIFTEPSQFQPQKKRLLGPTSRRDPRTLWEPEDQLMIPSSPESSMFVPKSPPTKPSQRPDSSTSGPWSLSKIRAIQEERDAATKSTPRTKRAATSPSLKSFSPPPKLTNTQEIIDLLSDDGEETEDDLMFASSTKKKSAYDPVDNSMFAAYEQTNNIMGMGRRRKR